MPVNAQDAYLPMKSPYPYPAQTFNIPSPSASKRIGGIGGGARCTLGRDFDAPGRNCGDRPDPPGATPLDDREEGRRHAPSAVSG